MRGDNDCKRCIGLALEHDTLTPERLRHLRARFANTYYTCTECTRSPPAAPAAHRTQGRQTTLAEFVRRPAPHMTIADVVE